MADVFGGVAVGVAEQRVLDVVEVVVPRDGDEVAGVSDVDQSVVEVGGGGGQAGDYRITDPWDGSTSKSLASYLTAGYNPRWIVTYEGAGTGCGRLLRPGAPPVTGFEDGAIYRDGVTIRPAASAAGASITVSRLPSARLGALQRWRLTGLLTVTTEGVYLVSSWPAGSAQASVLKFTIDRTAPSLDMAWLDVDGRAAASGMPTLDRPGRLELVAGDRLSGVQQVEYRLDDGAWTAYSDDVSFHRILSVPAPGPHRISVRAADVAGNSAVLDDIAFIVLDQPADPPPPGATPPPSPVCCASTVGRTALPRP